MLMKICILSLMIFFILARSVEGHEPLWCLCGETTTWEEDGYTESSNCGETMRDHYQKRFLDSSYGRKLLRQGLRSMKKFYENEGIQYNSTHCLSNEKEGCWRRVFSTDSDYGREVSAETGCVTQLELQPKRRNQKFCKKLDEKSLYGATHVESYCCNDKENCNEEKFDDDLKAMTQNFNA